MVVGNDAVMSEAFFHETTGRRIMNLASFVNLFDFEAHARSVMPPDVWGYVSSGAADEVTLRQNRQAFDELALRYRVLAGVAQRDQHVEVLGAKIGFPLLIAPTGFHQLIHPDGEIGTARAAEQAGALMVVSTMSNVRLEDIRAAVAGPLWFQLYVYKDRGITRELVDRATAAGYGAIQVTVDLPVLGRREADIRNCFGLPAHLRVANLEGAGFDILSAPTADSGIASYTTRMLDDALTWKDLDWLCALTSKPILVKGIVRGDDAERCLAHGASGIVVSNHGGRQLDTAIATIRALPEVVAAVAGRVPILLDGGVRRGTDIIKALALGACAVQIGRPVLWALAAGGQAGVRRMLELLRLEFDLALALCGCTTAAAVPRDLIAAAQR